MPTPPKKRWWNRTIPKFPKLPIVAGTVRIAKWVLTSRLIWGVLVAMFVLLLALVLGVGSSVIERGSDTSGSTNTDSWGIWIVKAISMILLVAITGFLVRLAYRECFTAPPAPPAPPPPAVAPPPPPAKFDWGKATKNVVLVLVVAVPVINVFLAGLVTGYWTWFFSHFTLFVFTNFGFIVAGHFFGKGNTLNRVVAGIIVFLIICGFMRATVGEKISSLRTGSFDGFSRPSSPFSNFGQPDLLRLTPEEHKATHDTLMKTPFAERKVLWALYECDPENESFRPDEKGQLPALATYRSKGVQAFGEACVEKLTRARQTFVLAVVEATSEKWSDPVILPEALGYDIVYSSKDKRHRTTVLGPEGQEMELAEGYTVPPFRTVGAKFKARAGTVRVTVEYRPTKGASSQ